MYAKYYIEKQSENRWNITQESSDEILATVKTKEEAMEYIEQLCEDDVNCTIVLNDKATYCINITCNEEFCEDN